MFEDLMINIFLNLTFFENQFKDASNSTIPNRIDTDRTMPTYIRVKLLKIKSKEKNLKAIIGRIRNIINVTWMFILNNRGKTKTVTLKYRKKEKTICPVRISFKN